MMPVNNVNFYALEKVLEAAKRFQKISEWLGHSPLDPQTDAEGIPSSIYAGLGIPIDSEGASLDTCIFMVEARVLANDLHIPSKYKS